MRDGTISLITLKYQDTDVFSLQMGSSPIGEGCELHLAPHCYIFESQAVEVGWEHDVQFVDFHVTLPFSVQNINPTLMLLFHASLIQPPQRGSLLTLAGGGRGLGGTGTCEQCLGEEI